ncbi:ABC transporter ATP-binding protein [Bradyrhizobium sp. USDA 4353]
MLRPKLVSLLSCDPKQAGPLAFVWHYVKIKRRQFAPLFGCVVIAGACAIAVQYEMKALVDAMAAPERRVGVVLLAFGLFISIVAVETICWRIAGWLGARAIVSAGVQIRLDLFEQLVAKPLGFFAEAFSGALGSRITAVSGAFGAIMNTFIWNILPPCVDFIGALVLFSIMDVGMAVAVFALVIAIGSGLLVFGLRGRGLHHVYARQAGRASGELIDTIANIRAVKMFGMRHREHRRLSAILHEEADAQGRSWTYLEKSRMLHDFFLWLSAACIFGWAVYRWTIGAFSPGDVVLVSALTFRILHGSRDLAMALIGTSNQIAVIRETLEVLEAHSTPSVGSIHLGRSEPPPINIARLCFAYREDDPVLSDISFDIPPGQRVGIIGESGAGKSTLLALLHRLHDPQRGEIRLGGHPLAAMSEQGLHDLIAFVPQDVGLFHRTILENLRYGHPDASEQEIMAAAEIAQCGFIHDLPDGLRTVVGEGGTVLSGGQRQRIAIARALLKNAPILLLDEATSALDVETERALRQALAGAFANRTIISATHRFATLEAFDRIIVLQNGRIIQDGSPAAVIGGHPRWDHSHLRPESQPGLRRRQGFEQAG